MRFAIVACLTLMATTTVGQPTLLQFIPPEGTAWYNATVEAFKAREVELKARGELDRREPGFNLIKGIKAATGEVKDFFTKKETSNPSQPSKAGALAGLLGVECNSGDNAGCGDFNTKHGTVKGKCSCMWGTGMLTCTCLPP